MMYLLLLLVETRRLNNVIRKVRKVSGNILSGQKTTKCRVRTSTGTLFSTQASQTWQKMEQ